jgi:5'-nucleotidase
MQETRPLVLVTNDDGVDSDGLEALAAAAGAFGEVWVVAPSSEQSGVGMVSRFTGR